MMTPRMCAQLDRHSLASRPQVWMDLSLPLLNSLRRVKLPIVIVSILQWNLSLWHILLVFKPLQLMNIWQCGDCSLGCWKQAPIPSCQWLWFPFLDENRPTRLPYPFCRDGLTRCKAGLRECSCSYCYNVTGECDLTWRTTLLTLCCEELWWHAQLCHQCMDLPKPQSLCCLHGSLRALRLFHLNAPWYSWGCEVTFRC